MMPAMFKRLIHRNVALLVGVVLTGQVLAGGLVLLLVVRPQVDRIAHITADTISALSLAMAGQPESQRLALLERINGQGGMMIRTLADAPSDGPRFPNFVERQFIRALADQLTTQEQVIWRTDRDSRLWILLRLGNEDYWVSVSPPQLRGAFTSLLLAFCIAFVVAVVVGLGLQRRLDQPLRRLAEAVDGFAPEQAHAPLDASGPLEVAAVATALNRMTRRLADQEAERALMLGGVSHDLRTPLTRLRLALEMMRGHDAELENSALRQVDRIESMLGQFLDLARGFEAEPFRTVALAPLLTDVVADCGSDQVSVSVGEELHAALRPSAISRAVANLIGNALRHGSAPVMVIAAVQGERLLVSVCDRGPGLDPAQAADLVRPFARGDSARGGDGTGLGLAIVDRIVRAHDGTLRFLRKAEGFCMQIDLPLNGSGGSGG